MDEYNLASVPAIVYFRYATPILYQGTLNKLRLFRICMLNIFTFLSNWTCISCHFSFLGDLMDEAAVLEWLIQNRSTGDEDDVIEDVDMKSLETMIQSIEQLAVLFCEYWIYIIVISIIIKVCNLSINQWINFLTIDDPDSRKVDQLLETLERIDDDCAVRGIHFVKVASDDNDNSNDVFGIEKLPKLVYFENNQPSMYEGELALK